MNDLLKETMESYNRYISGLSSGCQLIADLIREDRIQEALRSILQFSEGMAWIVDANRLLTENGQSNQLNPEKIHEFLEEINSGLEIQDYVIVADMFEYEIKPFFEDCALYEISEVQ